VGGSVDGGSGVGDAVVSVPRKATLASVLNVPPPASMGLAMMSAAAASAAASGIADGRKKTQIVTLLSPTTAGSSGNPLSAASANKSKASTPAICAAIRSRIGTRTTLATSPTVVVVLSKGKTVQTPKSGCPGNVGDGVGAVVGANVGVRVVTPRNTTDAAVLKIPPPASMGLAMMSAAAAAAAASGIADGRKKTQIVTSLSPTTAGSSGNPLSAASGNKSKEDAPGICVAIRSRIGNRMTLAKSPTVVVVLSKGKTVQTPKSDVGSDVGGAAVDADGSVGDCVGEVVAPAKLTTRLRPTSSPTAARCRGFDVRCRMVTLVGTMACRSHVVPGSMDGWV
jgi:hypothetical protein